MLHGLIFPTKDYWCLGCGKWCMVPGTTCDECRLGDDARTWADKKAPHKPTGPRKLRKLMRELRDGAPLNDL